MIEPLQLGKYAIRKVLGKGAMGIVYAAYDPSLERQVAIKTIKKQLLKGADSAEILERFRREAKAVARLTHPNIVTAFDFGDNDEMAYIVMECVDGASLKEIISTPAPIPLMTALEFGRQLLEALDYAHRQGIVHRDIKPANLLVSKDNVLKVTDFGVVRLDDSTLTQHGAILGTPFYMAPEQIAGLTLDGRTDLFSAGVILFEMFSGAKPFSGTTISVMHKIANEPHPRPSSVNRNLPHAFDQFFERALAKNPESRFANGKAMLEGLRAAWNEWQHGTADQDAPTLVLQRRDIPAIITTTGLQGDKNCPYAFLNLSHDNVAALFHNFVENWDEATRELGNLDLSKWFRDGQGSTALAERLAELNSDRNLTSDDRLQLLVWGAVPRIPPVWKGHRVDRESLLALARSALAGDGRITELLAELVQRNVLARFANGDLERIGARWSAALSFLPKVERDIRHRVGAAFSGPVPLKQVHVATLLALLDPQWLEKKAHRIEQVARENRHAWMSRQERDADAGIVEAILLDMICDAEVERAKDSGAREAARLLEETIGALRQKAYSVGSTAARQKSEELLKNAEGRKNAGTPMAVTLFREEFRMAELVDASWRKNLVSEVHQILGYLGSGLPSTWRAFAHRKPLLDHAGQLAGDNGPNETLSKQITWIANSLAGSLALMVTSAIFFALALGSLLHGFIAERVSAIAAMSIQVPDWRAPLVLALLSVAVSFALRHRRRRLLVRLLADL